MARSNRTQLTLACLVLGLAAAPGQEAAPPSRALLLELTAGARLAGTTGSVVAAHYVGRKLEEAGWEVELDEREVLLSLPRALSWSLHASEDAFEDAAEPLAEWSRRFDPDAVPPGDVPPFNAWSASGEVRGLVVDAGRGLRVDFERLREQGVELASSIALVRYGGSYRGVKAELAEEYGCAGVLLFSDPAGDGKERGETWPQGPWKPGWAAQRGSISKLARAPGDPSTPGFPSPAPGESVQRSSGEELAEALPRILCLPIGADHAATIQAALEGVGPGPAHVRLSIDQPLELRRIVNTIGRLRGRDDFEVLAGNHRDAWVRGAHDAGSGTVSLLRAAQQLGERARSGWQPQHTIVLGFWDAEESGLIGSTEWAEARAEQLREHGLVYVNADAAVSGTQFGASAAPGLKPALLEVLEKVGAPNEEGSLAEQWSARSDGAPTLSLPGSGSDYTVFLHHLGMPILDISFGGNRGGQYHTSFDDFAMVERYLDPGFVGHELAGEFLAELLADWADHPSGGFDSAEAARELTALAHRVAAEEDSPLAGEAGERLAQTFEDLAEAIQAAPAEGRLRADRRFYRELQHAGLPGRTWYRNWFWAPGLETGYAAESFPHLRAASAAGELPQVLDEAVQSLERYRASLRIAAEPEAAPPESGRP